MVESEIYSVLWRKAHEVTASLPGLEKSGSSEAIFMVIIKKK